MTPKAAMLRRLDQLRAAVEADDVDLIMLAAIGDALTVAVVGEMQPMPTMHASALALTAQVNECCEDDDAGDGLDYCLTGNDDEDDAEAN